MPVLKLYKNHLIPKDFDILDREKVYLFAERFGLRTQVEEFFSKVFDVSDKPGDFEL